MLYSKDAKAAFRTIRPPPVEEASPPREESRILGTCFPATGRNFNTSHDRDQGPASAPSRPTFHWACPAEGLSRRAFEATGDFRRLSDTTSSPFRDCCYRKADIGGGGGLHLGFNHLLAAHKKKHPSAFISIYGISYVCLCRSAIPHATASGGNAGVWIRRRA